MHNRKAAMMIGGLMLAAVLGGCGKADSESAAAAGHNGGPETTGNTESTGAANAAGADTVQTVRVWTNDSNLQLLYEDAIAGYNATVGKEKGIVIDYQVFGSDYNDVLKVALAAEQGPELYKFVGTTKDSFVEAGWMLPFEELPDSEEMLNKWEPVIIPGYNTYKDKTYSLPVKALNTKFLYNKDLLKKNGFDNPPETWQELVAMAKVITDNGNGEEFGFGLSLKDAGSVGKWSLAAQFAAATGHMGFDFKSGEYRFTDFLPVLECLQQMRADGSIFPGFEALSNDGLAAHFAEGRVAFLPSVTWDVNTYNNTFEVKNEWGVFQTPVLDKTNAYKSYAQLADMMCIGPAAKAMPEKAMEVYEFLHNDEILVEIQEAGVEFIGLESIQQQVTAPPALVGWKEFADTSKSYFTMTPPDGSLELEGQTYQNVLVNLLSSDMSAEEVRAAIGDLDKRYNEALKRAIGKGLDMDSFVDPNWDTRLPGNS